MAKISFMIALCIFAVYAADLKCTNYLCGGLDNGQCAKQTVTDDNVTINLNPCKDGYFCDIHFNEDPDVCSEKKLIAHLYPGEYCSDNLECLSGLCNVTSNTTSNKYCIGKVLGDSCTQNIDCNPNLYCDTASNTCLAAKKLGETCNNNCIAGLLCHGGQCIALGSIKKGESATMISACETFYIVDGLCSKGPALVKNGSESGPILCTDGCTYLTAKGDSVVEDCQCGRTSTGLKLCSPGYGDISMSDVLISQ